MRDDMEEVLKLQSDYTYTKSPTMDRRGALVSKSIPSAIRSVLNDRDELSSLGWAVEGSNGKGSISAVPWVRIFDSPRSPKATDGWYLVYLFNALGASAYLTLMQGTSEWSVTRGKFVPRSPALIADRVTWARNVIRGDQSSLSTHIALNSSNLQPKGYELGVVYAIEYPSGEMPTNAVLAEDIVTMSRLLEQLYKAVDTAPFIPGDTPPEIQDAELAAAQSAGNTRTRRHSGQGFKLTVEEKSAIEEHSVAMAIGHFEGRDYEVTNVGATESYDLTATKAGEALTVEVKGTTSLGGEVILTYNEVQHHQSATPANALVVVHSIELDKTGPTPVASGGVLVVKHPWSIDDADLKPISYRYATGI